MIHSYFPHVNTVHTFSAIMLIFSNEFEQHIQSYSSKTEVNAFLLVPL